MIQYKINHRMQHHFTAHNIKSYCTIWNYKMQYHFIECNIGSYCAIWITGRNRYSYCSKSSRKTQDLYIPSYDIARYDFMLHSVSVLVSYCAILQYHKKQYYYIRFKIRSFCEIWIIGDTERNIKHIVQMKL